MDGMLGPNWVPMWVITREVPWWDESWVDWMEELSDGRMGILWVGFWVVDLVLWMVRL